MGSSDQNNAEGELFCLEPSLRNVLAPTFRASICKELPSKRLVLNCKYGLIIKVIIKAPQISYEAVQTAAGPKVVSWKSVGDQLCKLIRVCRSTSVNRLTRGLPKMARCRDRTRSFHLVTVKENMTWSLITMCMSLKKLV